MSAGEPIAVLGPGGEPVTGPGGGPLVKRRDEIHRDDDWHAAFHLWVLCADGIVLQRRGAHKQAWPRRLDASAAGHLTAGEQPLDGLREAEEELGVRYSPDRLNALGVFRVDEQQPDGTINREHQHVYAVRDPRPVTAFTAIDRGELDGLVVVTATAFTALAGGADADGIAWDGERAEPVVVGAAELVPAPYFIELSGVCAKQVAGSRASGEGAC